MHILEVGDKLDVRLDRLREGICQLRLERGRESASYHLVILEWNTCIVLAEAERGEKVDKN